MTWRIQWLLTMILILMNVEKAEGKQFWSKVAVAIQSKIVFLLDLHKIGYGVWRLRFNCFPVSSNVCFWADTERTVVYVQCADSNWTSTWDSRARKHFCKYRNHGIIFYYVAWYAALPLVREPLHKSHMRKKIVKLWSSMCFWQHFYEVLILVPSHDQMF